MATCEPNDFTVFQDPGDYPQPVVQFKVSNPSHPTNSWFQNAIDNNINDSNRIVNTTPWYWMPQYTNKTYIGISLDSQLNQNTSVVLDNGNFSYQDNPSHAVIIGKDENNQNFGTNLETTRLDDLSATLRLDYPNGMVFAYPFRGSPFATLKYNNTNAKVYLRWQTQGLSGALTNITGGYRIESSGVKVSSVTELLYQQLDGTYKSQFMSIYEGVEPTSDKIEVCVLSTSKARFKFLNFDLTIDANNLNQTYPPGVTPYKNGNSTFGFNILCPEGGGLVYNINVNIPSTGPITSTFTQTEPKTYRWLIYTTATLTKNGNTLLSTETNFTGSLQLVCLGNDSSKFSSLQTFYDTYKDNYSIKGEITNFTSSGHDLEIDLEPDNTEFLVLLPSHWEGYTLTNATKLTPAQTGNNDFIDLTYGKMSYYKLTNDLISVDLGTFNPPTNLDVSSINSQQQTMLKTRTLKDAQITTINTSLNPYDFGQQAATAGKICALAKVLGEASNSDVLALLGVLKSSIILWLDEDNPIPFRLVAETIWGGVIVPADAIAKSPSDPTAYGNSFYNDHHFHYGYFLYAVWCCELYNNDLSSNATYLKRINNILCDVCNPESTGFSTKIRHKDFYAGHSWATGVGPKIILGKPLPASPARQQESSGEAINCYYACYLLSNLLVTKTVDVVRYTKIRNAAKVSLKLELDASRNYYQLLGPDTRLGDFDKVAGVGIIENLGKQYTLDWGMQPDTYNGRSLGLYGIQSIPVTEISFTHLSSGWTKTLNDVNKTLEIYRITPELVIGLNSASYVPLLNKTTAIQPVFNPVQDGGFWGNVGNMMLAPNCNVTNSQIHQAWVNLINKQNKSNPNGNNLIKHFDSYSNTMYWLMRHSRFNEGGLEGSCTKVMLGETFILISHPNKTETETIKIVTPKQKCGCCNRCGQCRCGYCKNRQKTHTVCYDVDIGKLLKGNDEKTLIEKALCHNKHPNDIIIYTAIKLGLIHLSCDVLEPKKQLK